VHLRDTIKFRFIVPFLLTLFNGSVALSQAPNIKMTASPTSLYPFQNITFTITVESNQKLKAAVLDAIPVETNSVSVQQSGANSDKCTEKTGLGSFIGPTGKTVLCPVSFPGTETITIVVSANNPGTVTNTAALVWSTNTQPPKIENVQASASIVVIPAPIVSIFSNFVLNPPCTMAAPGSCVSTNSVSVNGNMPTFEVPPFPAFTFAVSFTPSVSLRLSDIAIPFGLFPGPNLFDVWVTADNNGSPGTVLEKFIVTGFPNGLTTQPPPITVISSAIHPPLTAGTQFWLVIGPGVATSFGAWSLSLSDPATPTNYLVSPTTTVGVMPLQGLSQWVPATTDMQTIRVAFQIDGTL
jgi:hypothetical protein